MAPSTPVGGLFGPDAFMPPPFMPAIPMDPPSPGPEYPMPPIDFIPTPIPEPPPFERRRPEDIDPGFTWPPHRPKGPLPMPDWRGPGGSSNPEDFMGGEGFDNPEHGFGDTIGGSFAGFGRMTRACNIPNEIQPTTPPEGLFGPDGFIPIWGNPGYNPPGIGGKFDFWLAGAGGLWDMPWWGPLRGPHIPSMLDDLTDPTAGEAGESREILHFFKA